MAFERVSVMAFEMQFGFAMFISEYVSITWLTVS